MQADLSVTGSQQSHRGSQTECGTSRGHARAAWAMASSASTSSGDERPSGAPGDPSAGAGTAAAPPQVHAEWAASMQAYYAAGGQPYAWHAAQVDDDGSIFFFSCVACLGGGGGVVHDLIRVFVHATAHDGGGCGGGGAAVRDTGAVPRVIPPRLLRGHGHGE